MESVTVQGVEVPTVGLGTWRLSGETCYETVKTALELGYRHVDTAQLYGNEAAVGRAIGDSDVPREEVFLTTKVHPGNVRYDDVLESTRASLDRLGTDYVDLLLQHWPNPLVSFADTARAMAELRDAGLVRHVGVSNFRRWRLRRARQKADIPILADQVRCNPHYTHSTLREYCAAEDVLLTAYSPLAEGAVVEDDRLAAIGEPYGFSPAQVVLRWLTQLENVVAIPKSTSRDHLAENLDVFEVTFDDAEMAAVPDPSVLKTLGSVLG